MLVVEQDRCEVLCGGGWDARRVQLCSDIARTDVSDAKSQRPAPWLDLVYTAGNLGQCRVQSGNRM